MFNLSNLFKKNSDVFLQRDEIAKMLKTSPEKLAEFEKYYQTQVLPNLEPESDNMFNVNAKQAAAMTSNKKISNKEINTLIHRIVAELSAQTSTYVYDGKIAAIISPNELGDDARPVTLDDITALPAELRPQLSGSLMKADMPAASHMLLWYLDAMQKTNNPAKKQDMYHHFRQGLDIMDLDGLTYEMIGMNTNSMGHWLPQLVEANTDKDFFKIPKTVIAKVPLTLLQLTHTEWAEITSTTKAIINQWAMATFNLETNKDYFIKTGTYSSKFDFRNCHVNDPKEITEIGEYLLYIHFSALQMASPLNKPCIYGVSTTNEWVVREYIPDKENNPIIYKGLPLHTEYRVFIDCNDKTVLDCVPYWDPDVMKKRFEENRDGHDIHDYISYKAHEDTLMSRYEQNKDLVIQKVAELLPDLDLKGQWSLDIMQNGDDFWLIDMALAELSAGYTKAVPIEKRRPSKENWLPEL